MIRRLRDLIIGLAVERATARLRLDLAELLDHRNYLAEQLVAARQRIDALEAAADPAPVEPELETDTSWDAFVKAST